MKKILSAILVLLLALCISGCNNTNSDTTAENNPDTSFPKNSSDVSLVDSSYNQQTPENNQEQDNQSKQVSNPSFSASTSNNEKQNTSSSELSSTQDLQQKIAEENARHENVINGLNQKKQDILSLRDARFNALGTSYSGTEEEYLAKQSELRNRSNKLQFFISSCRGNLSQSTQKKLRDAQKEKEAVDAELSALESAMSVKRLKQDIENQTKTQINDVEKEIQAENDLHARNLALLK